MKQFSSMTRRNFINFEIDKHMKKIVEIILKKVSPFSILLGGSFARGEGCVKMRGKKIFPYNDYDIYVITEKPVSENVKKILERETSEIIGYEGISILTDFKKQKQIAEKNFYVDLKFLLKKDLWKVLPRLRNYELKTARLLYGKDATKIIKKIDLKDVPLSEGVKLLLDRMSQLSYYYSQKGYDAEFLTYIVQQAYAACLTALLLLSGKYETGYIKNMQNFLKTYRKDFPRLAKKLPNLDKKIGKFIEWRILPTKLPENPEKAWFECRQDILEVTKYFLSVFLKKRIDSIEELSESILKMAVPYYLPYLRSKFNGFAKATIPLLNIYFKFIYFAGLKRKSVRVFFNLHSPDMIIFSVVPYVLFGIEKDGKENQEMVKKATNILNKIYPIKKKVAKKWEELSLEYAEAYFAFYLQKIA